MDEIVPPLCGCWREKVWINNGWFCPHCDFAEERDINLIRTEPVDTSRFREGDDLMFDQISKRNLAILVLLGLLAGTFLLIAIIPGGLQFVMDLFRQILP